MSFKRFIPFLVAFVLPLLIVYAWWGGFNPVNIQTEVRGPYVYAYLESKGDYSKLPDKQTEVGRRLLAQGIQAGNAITVLYSNPDVVNIGDRVGRTGFLVPAGSRVSEPLKLAEIPARQVLTARVRAAILMAPSRAYSALDKHLQAQGKGIHMPTVEIYQAADRAWHMGELIVEMEQ